MMRYRAPSSWADRAEAVSDARGRGEQVADLQREAFLRFLEEEERRLGIEPVRTTEEPPEYRAKKKKK